MESRLIDLEIRLTHQEVALQELSDALLSQQKRMDRLNFEIERLKQQLATQTELPTAASAEENRPPHY